MARLQEFLAEYSAQSKIFDRIKLGQAKRVNSNLFKARFSAKEKEEILIEWYEPNNEVILAGPKQTVQDKLNEFEKNVENPAKSK